MSRTVFNVGKCVTNAGKWIWGGHLPVGKSFAKKILEHCQRWKLELNQRWFNVVVLAGIYSSNNKQVIKLVPLRVTNGLKDRRVWYVCENWKILK